MHKAGYVHCDMKPDNILVGNQPDSINTIYLIDYGLAHKYLDLSTGDHLKMPTTSNFKGSISYCSLNLLNKQCILFSFIFLDPSRRDDIESLIYVILFLMFGQLPWHEGA